MAEDPQSLPPIQQNNGAPSGNDQDSQLDVMARRVLEEIATVGTGAEMPLDEYIRILAEYRHACELRENYKEAELVQHVLKHLRLEEETRHVKGLTEQQEAERRGLEDAHMMEFSNFNKIWNERIDAFEEHQLDAQAAMLERHSQELAAFRADMANGEHRRVKYSKDLLNLRSIQQTLAQQRNYADAQKVKLKGDKIEALEYEKISREKAEIYARKEAQILQRHRQELAALAKRMDRGKLELERARKKELEMLLQRYNNVRRGLEGQQNIIRSKTGQLLIKHANNVKTDNSGSHAIMMSMSSGAFGPGVRRRQFDVVPPGTAGSEFGGTRGSQQQRNAQSRESLPPV
eukprot:CAMPEP_0174849960 /NCGR_PEP_ID=MMETSP1114-20130205/18440_1 /TAXON_ID=312471 /ORGANISM="Neobodo designis, Strain CCAP 1951/1" /LENGTH=346 /DNA_ID=CAMNT_0016084381 /DNA_START=141 /DNA_END=1181 /DNA_ORIENTATION=+